MSRLSNLEDNEYATLLANLNLIFMKQFQCFSKKFNTEQQMKMHKIRNHCDDIMPVGTHCHKSDNVKYRTCYCNFYDPGVGLLIQISEHLEKFGNLPVHLIKTNKISSKLEKIHNIIQSFIYEVKQEEIKKQQEQSNRR